jgi:uncharacterized protein
VKTQFINLSLLALAATQGLWAQEGLPNLRQRAYQTASQIGSTISGTIPEGVKRLFPQLYTAQELTLKLFNAIRSGDLKGVNDAIKLGADVNAMGENRSTPLIMAIFRSPLPVIEALIKAGANVNTQGARWLPLTYATTSGRTPVVEALIKAGADVNARETRTGLSPLEYAAALGNIPVIEALVKAGADVNARDKDGTTALTLALKEHHPAAAETLRKAGARG